MTTWYILVGISALLVAIANIIRKHVLKHEHPLEFIAALAPFHLLILLLLIPFVTIPKPTHLIVIFLVSIFLLTLWIYQNRSYRHLPISSIAPLHNLSPIVLLVLAFVLLGEQPTGTQLFGVLLIIFGGYSIDLKTNDLFGPLRNARKHAYSGLIIVLLIMLSVMAVIDKTLVGTVGIPALTYLFWLYLFIAINSFFIEWYRYGLADIKRDLAKGWFWLLLAGICNISNMFFFLSAISMTGVLIALAIPIRRTSTLIETIIGGHLFHEQELLRKALGCVIMIAGVFFII